MIISITDQNKAEIADIMSSLMVCLQILLSQHDIEAKLAKYAPEQVNKTKSPAAITANIFEILRGQDFAVFRAHVDTQLEDHGLFKLRLVQVALLPATAEQLTQELIETIKDCDFEFLLQLNCLIHNQHKDIIRRCKELIKILLAQAHCDKLVSCTSTYTTYTTYTTYGNPTYSCMEKERSFLPGLDNFKKRIAEAVQESEIINTAAGVVWNLGANAYATVGSMTVNIGTIIFNSNKRSANDRVLDDVVEELEDARPKKRLRCTSE
jgi:hypothetical protein